MWKLEFIHFDIDTFLEAQYSEMATVTMMRRILEVAVGITKEALQLRLSESIDVQM